MPTVEVKTANAEVERKRILVTGGAGFVGSYVVDRAVTEGYDVTVVDNFYTGTRENLADHDGSPPPRYTLPGSA